MSDEKEMSSEVENQEIAQEALSAAEGETPPAGESEQQSVPLDKHVALRQRAQAAELDAANLRGQVTAMQQVQTQQVPAEKSPLELEIERQASDGIAEEDMTISPRIYRAEQLHQTQVTNQATALAAKKQLAQVQLTSADKAKAAHDDWQDIVSQATGLLTKGELLDIESAGDGFGELAYQKCIAAIARNKPENKTETAPETKPSKSKDDKTVPSQQDLLNEVVGDPATIAAARL